jgi:predicted acylesterase/phospholipase RssA
VLDARLRRAREGARVSAPRRKAGAGALVKVLAIDGGGIRGLIPALVLAEIEHRTGRAAASLFDLVAGTSTGAIIGCALTLPEPMPAARIAELYEQEGPRIFDRALIKEITSLGGLVDERYDASGLVETLRRHLGDTRLAQATIPLLVTTYDLEARSALVLTRDDDMTMVDAAHASSAAPTYFEPAVVGGRTLVDGGVFATNPAMLAYAEMHGELDVLASLGTGEHTRPLPFATVKDWGRLEWARPILDVVFDGNADAVDRELSALIDSRYVRLQTVLGEASDALDDASPGNLAALRREAERLIARRDADIERLCAVLTG